MSLVVDLCRTFPTGLGEYLDALIMALMEALKRPDEIRMVHTAVLSSFGELLGIWRQFERDFPGDMALALGAQFARYTEAVLAVLAEKAAMEVTDAEDFDQVDYLCSVRESCMEAYTGVLQGLEEADKASRELYRMRRVTVVVAVHQIVQAHVPMIITLLVKLATEDSDVVPDSSIAVALGLIGDLLKTYGAHIVSHLGECKIFIIFGNMRIADTPATTRLVSRAKRSKQSKCRSLANYVQRMLREARKAAAPVDDQVAPIGWLSSLG